MRDVVLWTSSEMTITVRTLLLSPCIAAAPLPLTHEPLAVFLVPSEAVFVLQLVSSGLTASGSIKSTDRGAKGVRICSFQDSSRPILAKLTCF